MNKDVKSFDQLDELILRYAQIEAKLAKSEAAMNEKIQKIRESYKEVNDPLSSERSEIEKILENFCIANKHEFQKQRSRDFTHGIVGFIFNPPKVAQLNKKYTVKTSIELLKRIFNDIYIRSKEEINKEAILADYASQKIDDQKLAAVGLKIDQDETFYISPKWETIEDKKAA